MLFRSNVMLVESLGFNLLSVRALNKMGFAVFLDIDIVVLLWSKTLTVAFIGYVEDDLFVVYFSGKTTSNSMCLFERPMWVGCGIAAWPMST